MPNWKPHTVLLDEVDTDRLKKLAAYDKTTKSTVLRTALFWYWQRCGEEAERLARFRERMNNGTDDD